MRCLNPIQIRNPKWLDGDAAASRWLSVPCGKCEACKMKRRKDWTFRLQQESKHSVSQLFVTLTYDETFLPYDENGLAHVSKRDCQLFLKRLREIVRKVSDVKLRYYLCSEYGPTTLRPHYHLVLFNFPVDVLKAYDTILKAWSLGFVQVGPLLDGGSSYVCKYLLADFDYSYYPRKKPFSLMSKGLGKDFIDEKIITYCYAHGTYIIPTSRDSHVVLPRYFRTKIFSEEDLPLLTEKVRSSVERTICENLSRDVRRYDPRTLTLSGQEIESYKYKVKRNLKSKHKISSL